MPYLLKNLEITQPLPTLALSEEDTGMALIVRRKNRPIGFLMQALPAKSVVTPEDLAKAIVKKLGNKLIEESIREELASPLESTIRPSLTVAICTKDRTDNLARCLQSLLRIRTDNPGENSWWNILVVDNAPSDERTKELVGSLDNIDYVLEPKPGLNFARNKALDTATGEYLAFVDDDVVVDRQWLNGFLEAWAENPDAGGFTGLVLPYELATEAQILFESREGWNFRRTFNKIRYEPICPKNDLYPCYTGEFGVGCNMAFRREVLLQIGGFDEALDTGKPLPGGGDHDIFYRVIRAGYSLIYEPSYLVFHQHRQEYKQLFHQHWTWGLSLMAFATKTYQTDPENRAKWLLLIGFWFKELLRQLLKSLLGKYVAPPDLILVELWGSVVGLFGEYSRSQQRIEKIRRQHS